ncbi:type ISP restriction/modification enzyme [Rhodopila sp.]|uniref:type ISP restriction/modification enzyme n=1 Tax=Rhodopila sp. TaxID=2480087 RepID=UPI003D0E9375
MQFEGPKGEHLFRSTLVQTLFYGLFSAWVEVAQDGQAVFDWRAAGWNLHVPFVDTLFERIARPRSLKPLGLEEPLSWAAAALNRVDRIAFFTRFEEADAVRYFYEPFLAAFDPDLRKDMGVWYTPREIVRYMVERVDQVLRSELGIPDGLADPSVWVLDPCCGTGAYLVEVLARIARTLKEKGEDALTADDLKQAAMTRVAGFEIMPAPYVIAHWQVGHALRAAGAPLGPEERAAVYLTNALTGWAAPQAGAGPGDAQHGIRFTYPPLADERDEAARVKQARPILVVLGNPPYNAFAGTSPAEESGLVEPYKEGLQRDWGIRKFNLDDLYVRFFRIAERRIAGGTGRGIICFISNHSWLSSPSFVVMRQRLLAEFDRIWVDNLHGDRKSSERGRDGRTSETVFAMRGASLGIQQGTAISMLVRTPTRAATTQVLFNNRADASDAGERRGQLLAMLESSAFDEHYDQTSPVAQNRYSFRPASVAADYQSWPPLPYIAALEPFSGVVEKRHGALRSLDRSELADRMRRYFDPKISFEELKVLGIGPVEDMAGFKAYDARTRLLRSETFSEKNLRLLALYPFEVRWAYHTNVQQIWNRSRPELSARAFPGNGFVVARLRARRPEEGFPLFWTPVLPGDHILDPNAHPMPVLADPAKANLSVVARGWLAALALPNPDTDHAIAALPWHHALAIGYAPAWLAENGDAIRQDWPRVPLPDNADLLRASAALGARVAALLDPDTPVVGVTTGTLPPAIQIIAVPSKRGGGAMAEAERRLTAGWGHAGKSGAVMAGRGRISTRDYAPEEAAAAADAACLGATTHDVFLNQDAYWRNIPETVWRFTIGGYQVLKKWLSYREQPLLGRALTPAEVRYVRDVARRLTALRLMAPELDANYRACAATHRPLNGVPIAESVMTVKHDP